MKTTLNLPDELMRAVKVRAATTDRRIKDVVAEAIAVGLAASNDPAFRKGKGKARQSTKAKAARKSASAKAPIDPLLQAVFDAGDEMVRQGVDIDAWAKTSRDVWR